MICMIHDGDSTFSQEVQVSLFLAVGDDSAPDLARSLGGDPNIQTSKHPNGQRESLTSIPSSVTDAKTCNLLSCPSSLA